MKLSKEDLDKSLCDIINTDNTQTWREWIREMENDFEIENKDLDNMTEKQLNEYDDWLDYLNQNKG